MIASRSLVEHPILPLQKTKSNWSQVYRSPTPALPLQESSSAPCLPEIRELVHRLAEVENVARVRAVTPRAGDLHWIEFELEPQSGSQLSDETWEQAENLVIDYEWKLRDETGEEWYYYTQVVTQFSQLNDGGSVVAASYIQPMEFHQKIQSNFTKFFV